MILKTMSKNVVYRAWFYFRQGWSTYFAFIFAAINTMVVTYYLAIRDVPSLKVVFPTFSIYIIVLSFVGIPLLTAIGYAHMKKSAIFRAEAEIGIESNPFMRKILTNTESLFPIYSSILSMLIKLSKNEKLNDDDLKKIDELQKELNYLMKTSYKDKSRPANKEI
jgi:hypothetical protein